MNQNQNIETDPTSNINMESASPVFDPGICQDKSLPSDSTVTPESDSTESLTLSNDLDYKTPLDSASSTVVSPRPNKRKISDVRSTISNTSTQNTTTSTRTSPPEQTSKGKGYSPFWNTSIEGLLDKLWSCTETDLHVSERNSWTKSLKDLALDSWFTVKVSKTTLTNTTTSSQSLPSLSQAITVNEQRKIAKEEEKKVAEKEKAEQTKLKKQKSEEDERRARVANGWTDEDKAKLFQMEQELQQLNQQYSSMTHKKKRKKHSGLIKRKQNDICKLKMYYMSPEVYGEVKAAKPKREKRSKLLRARKVKIHPDKEQKMRIDNWIDSSRFVYNQIVALNRKDEKIYEKKKTDRMRLFRDHITKLMEMEDHKWLKDVPEQIRDDAISDYEKAQTSNLAKRKKNPQFTWKINFRSRKNVVQETTHVNARDWTNKGGLFGWLKHVKANEPLPDVIGGALSITRTRLGEYYFAVLSECEYNENQPHWEVIALDPGVRTFQTGYDINGMTIEWGAGDMQRVFALCRFADRLQSDFTKETNKRSRRAKKKAWLRMLRRIRNKIDEAHRKLATFLCRHYKVILLPKFDTKKMVKKVDRKITNRTARSMCTWGHYRFRELLRNKAELYTKCTVVICDEHYTSKTCGSCGKLHKNLGKNKVFDCPNCDYVADRDINAARNILIRYVSLNPEVLDILTGGGSSDLFAPTACPSHP